MMFQNYISNPHKKWSFPPVSQTFKIYLFFIHHLKKGGGGGIQKYFLQHGSKTQVSSNTLINFVDCFPIWLSLLVYIDSKQFGMRMKTFRVLFDPREQETFNSILTCEEAETLSHNRKQGIEPRFKEPVLLCPLFQRPAVIQLTYIKYPK